MIDTYYIYNFLYFLDSLFPWNSIKCTLLYRIALYCILFYCLVFYCLVLYCIVSSSIIITIILVLISIRLKRRALSGSSLPLYRLCVALRTRLASHVPFGGCCERWWIGSSCSNTRSSARVQNAMPHRAFLPAADDVLWDVQLHGSSQEERACAWLFRLTLLRPVERLTTCVWTRLTWRHPSQTYGTDVLQRQDSASGPYGANNPIQTRLPGRWIDG